MSLDESVMEQKVIDAGRFVLRPLRKSDEGLIAHYVSDERVARMTSAIPHPLPPGAIEAFVTRAMDPPVKRMSGPSTARPKVVKS